MKNRMKELRKKKGLTLAEIADQVGVTEATVQRWESGNIKSIPLDRACRLAEILCTTPLYLLGLDAEPNDITDKKPSSMQKRIKARRKELGLSVEQIAAAIGISPSSLYRYEKSEIKKIPSDVLRKLSIILKTTIDDFYNEEPTDGSNEIKMVGGTERESEKTFGEKIKERRKELGLTTDDVAQRVGVSNATVSRWETGSIDNQRRDKLKLLADALEVTLPDLLSWSDLMHDETSIYTRMRTRRQELNLSQNELAQLMGYKSRSSINKIEAGETDIPHSKIEEFAKALQTTQSFLMGITDNPQDISDVSITERARDNIVILASSYGPVIKKRLSEEQYKVIADLLHLLPSAE